MNLLYPKNSFPIPFTIKHISPKIAINDICQHRLFLLNHYKTVFLFCIYYTSCSFGKPSFQNTQTRNNDEQ